MNFKKSISVFFTGLLLCTVFRTLQIIKTVDYDNGFFVEKYKTAGILLSLLIVLICGISAFLFFKAKQITGDCPKPNILISLTSFLTAVALFDEAFNQVFPESLLWWHIGIVRLLTVLCAFYFAGFALSIVIKVKVNPTVHIIPVIYAIVKTVFTFIGISSLAFTVDNIFMIAGYSLLMLFFVNYGKLYNGLFRGIETGKIYIYGFTCATVCIFQSLAYFIVNIFKSEKYIHSDVHLMTTLFFMGIFVVVFTVSCFLQQKRVSLKNKNTL